MVKMFKRSEKGQRVRGTVYPFDRSKGTQFVEGTYNGEHKVENSGTYMATRVYKVGSHWVTNPHRID